VTALHVVRAILAAGFVVVGAIIVAEMLRYPIAYTFSGIILGLAMIALGIVRLRALLGRSAP
jgi:hypothetical protein